MERLSCDNDSSNDIRELGGIPLLITLIQLVVILLYFIMKVKAGILVNQNNHQIEIANNYIS